jgi:hypothetical protein
MAGLLIDVMQQNRKQRLQNIPILQHFREPRLTRRHRR